MIASIYEAYGSPDILQFKEVEKPTPKDDQVLIKILATTVTAADWRVRSLTVPTGFRFIMRLVFGFSKPKQPILGSELAGVIESVGSTVTKFKAGDAVFAFSDASMGCHAPYKCMAQDGAIALKSANLSFEEAAALSFGGTTALDFIKRAALQSGESVLINGASGSVGTAAVQLAKHFGADVTAVCSTSNLDLVKSLGADHVIDYTNADFTQNGRTYDVIMDNAGTAPFSRSKGSLKPNGRLLLVLAGLPDMLQGLWVSMSSTQKVIAGPVSGNKAEDLRYLAELAIAGIFKPVIDRSYPFEQIVEAHRYVDTGRKKGNVAIVVKHID
jgi:NADPH:quinone reductase-like Zn-dependent oxidoreductase